MKVAIFSSRVLQDSEILDEIPKCVGSLKICLLYWHKKCLRLVIEAFCALFLGLVLQ